MTLRDFLGPFKVALHLLWVGSIGMGCSDDPVQPDPDFKGWKEQSVGGEYLYSVSAFDADIVFAGGEKGVFFKSTNGGESWNRQELQTTYTLASISTQGSRTAMAVGYNMGGRSIVFGTTDQGQAWSRLAEDLTPSLDCISLVTPQVAVAAGSNGYHYATSDGGLTWKRGVTALDGRIVSLHANSETSWVGVGMDWEDEHGGYIVKYTKDGARFIHPVDSLPGLTSVDFADSNTGWAVGLKGIILKTMDGGLNWFPQTSGTGDLWSISVVNASIAYAVGPGVILKTKDGGAVWKIQKQGDFGLYAVSAVDSNVVFAVGGGGIILRTTNGGEP